MPKSSKIIGCFHATADSLSGHPNFFYCHASFARIEPYKIIIACMRAGFILRTQHKSRTNRTKPNCRPKNGLGKIMILNFSSLFSCQHQMQGSSNMMACLLKAQSCYAFRKAALVSPRQSASA